jgi:hypothetical protein
VSSKEQPQPFTTVYPLFDPGQDFWFARIGGCGLGNCFYTYFQAFALAERFNATMIAPPWFTLKLGPVLRGETSKRFYWRMFKPFPGDIHGLDKLRILLRDYRKRAVIEIDGLNEPALVIGALNVIISKQWTFQGLHAYRKVIRERLLGIINDPAPSKLRWGQGEFIGIHVRLSDFKTIPDPNQVTAAGHSARIPMFWYVNVARALRKRFPNLPILLFSDGKVEELQPLLDMGARLYRSGSDVTDLLAMCGASILVGSNSTYSRWAAFLGNMPSIWLKGARIDKEVTGDRMVDPQVPVLHVALDATEVTLWS